MAFIYPNSLIVSGNINTHYANKELTTFIRFLNKTAYEKFGCNLYVGGSLGISSHSWFYIDSILYLMSDIDLFIYEKDSSIDIKLILDYLNRLFKGNEFKNFHLSNIAKVSLKNLSMKYIENLEILKNKEEIIGLNNNFKIRTKSKIHSSTMIDMCYDYFLFKWFLKSEEDCEQISLLYETAKIQWKTNHSQFDIGTVNGWVYDYKTLLETLILDLNLSEESSNNIFFKIIDYLLNKISTQELCHTFNNYALSNFKEVSEKWPNSYLKHCFNLKLNK